MYFYRNILIYYNVIDRYVMDIVVSLYKNRIQIVKNLYTIYYVRNLLSAVD